MSGDEKILPYLDAGESWQQQGHQVPENPPQKILSQANMEN